MQQLQGVKRRYSDLYPDLVESEASIYVSREGGGEGGEGNTADSFVFFFSSFTGAGRAIPQDRAAVAGSDSGTAFPRRGGLSSPPSLPSSLPPFYSLFSIKQPSLPPSLPPFLSTNFSFNFPFLSPYLQDAAAKEALDLTPERRLQAGVMCWCPWRR